MQTSLVLDNRSKQLNFQVKKIFEHGSDVCLKVNGVLNTVTAQIEGEGSLIKHFRLGKAPRFTEDDVYKPDQRLRLGIGTRSNLKSDDTHLTLVAKQKLQLAKNTDIIRGRPILNSYTQASLKLRYDYNVRTEQWGGEAIAAVSHAMFRFSEDQDVRVTAGCKVPITSSGTGALDPFLRIEENNWSVTTDLKGYWRAMYNL